MAANENAEQSQQTEQTAENGGNARNAVRDEDVPVAVELRDGDPVSELSQAGETATSGAAVAIGV